MAADLRAANELVALGPVEAALLRGRDRPIVIAPRRPGARVAAAVAPRTRELGVMLPYSPLHHLLLADVGEPLVMTSGNVSDEPIAYRDDDALERLAGIADLVLLHDRPIQTRTDDTVLRVARGRPLPLRRSRGAVPSVLALPVPATRHVLACGAELKSTFCLARGEPRVGRPPHRRPQERRDAGLVRGGRRPLREAVRGRPGRRRARPAPRLPLDHVRARARGRRARRGPAPPRPPRRLPGRARRARARPSGRSSTAPGSAPTAPSGAARSWSATCAASSAAGTCGRSRCRAATRPRASRGGWRARGGWRPAATRGRCAGSTPTAGARSRGSPRPAWRRRRPPRSGGSSTRSPRSAGCGSRSATRARRRSSWRRRATRPSAAPTRWTRCTACSTRARRSSPSTATCRAASRRARSPRASTTRSPTPRPTTARGWRATAGSSVVVLSGGAFQNRRLLERTAETLDARGAARARPAAAAAQRRRHLVRPGGGRRRARRVMLPDGLDGAAPRAAAAPERSCRLARGP